MIANLWPLPGTASGKCIKKPAINNWRKSPFSANAKSLLPITGGQLLLLGLGVTLYVVPYLLGVQMTELQGKNVERIVPMLVSSQNLDVALPLSYLSGALVGLLGLVAVACNLRSTGRRPAGSAPEAAR